MPAPIAFFAFNRPLHTQKVLTALAANRLAPQSELVVFCDGPRSEEEQKETVAVRSLCTNAKGFKSVDVVQRDANLGCGGSFRAGLQEFFTAHPAGIVVEDDILLAPNALQWFNACLERYVAEPSVFAVGAWSYPEKHMPFPADYPYDAYFIHRFQCWGWASWADRIRLVDWDLSDYDLFVANPVLRRAFAKGGADLPAMLCQQVNHPQGTSGTWDIQVAYTLFKHGCLMLVPKFPYATNLGTSGEGTHTGDGPPHPTLDIELSQALDSPRLPDHIFVDQAVDTAFINALEDSYFAGAVYSLSASCRPPTPSLARRVARRLERVWKF